MWHDLGRICYYQADWAAAIAAYETALPIWRAAGDKRGEANTLQAIGFMQLNRGEEEVGLEAVNAALAPCQAIGDQVGISNTLWDLGQHLAESGQLIEAEPLLAAAVELGQAFAPGHPVTEWRVSVLAQIRAQLRGEMPLPPLARQAELRADFGPLAPVVAIAADGDPDARAQVEGVFGQLTEGNWQIGEFIRRIWAGERDLSTLTAGIDSEDAFLVREMLAAVADPEGYAAGLEEDE